MKKWIAHLLFAVAILCLLACVLLTVFCVREYLALQGIQASGSEYLSFLCVPFFYLILLTIGGISFSLSRKLQTA